LPAARRAQAELAREHGVHGFCYYHYWFGGKRLLERPFAEVLSSGEPDFPFCLCWANEPWSRRWDGSHEDVLQPQKYDEEDDRAHIAALLPALADRRAIKVDGKPLFLVYHPSDLPNPIQTTTVWRGIVRAAGLAGLHLVAVENGRSEDWDPIAAGFDASVQFQPQWPILNSAPRVDVEGKKQLRVYNYQSIWPVLADAPAVRHQRYETAVPSWDNSARIGERAVVLSNATPDAYESWLRLLIRRAAARPPAHRMVFINAWNEWAEGCHLEPDARFGRAYLEATRRALQADASGRVPLVVRPFSQEAVLQV
jgi:lipopolysaccharide biosynthesis protein